MGTKSGDSCTSVDGMIMMIVVVSMGMVMMGLNVDDVGYACSCGNGGEESNSAEAC